MSVASMVEVVGVVVGVVPTLLVATDDVGVLLLTMVEGAIEDMVPTTVKQSNGDDPMTTYMYLVMISCRFRHEIVLL